MFTGAFDWSSGVWMFFMNSTVCHHGNLDHSGSGFTGSDQWISDHQFNLLQVTMATQVTNLPVCRHVLCLIKGSLTLKRSLFRFCHCLSHPASSLSPLGVFPWKQQPGEMAVSMETAHHGNSRGGCALKDCRFSAPPVSDR